MFFDNKITEKNGEKSFAYGWLDKVLSVTEGKDVSNFEYYPDGQLASTNSTNLHEEFVWDGLALIGRNETKYTVEPHVNGGSPILSTNGTNGTNETSVLFNDILGSSLGVVENGAFTGIERSAFGEQLENPSASFGSSQTTDNGQPTTDFWTGKPQVEGLGYAFLFRNYRADTGKWMSSDPLGYPDGWNNLAYVNNKTSFAIDRFGLEIVYIGTKDYLQDVANADSDDKTTTAGDILNVTQGFADKFNNESL